jgi:hypothetical protein
LTFYVIINGGDTLEHLFNNQGIGITSWEEVKGHGPNNKSIRGSLQNGKGFQSPYMLFFLLDDIIVGLEGEERFNWKSTWVC